MAERTIETKAIISAQDQTGTAFAQVANKLKDLEKVQQQVNRAGIKEAQRIQKAHADQQKAIRGMADAAAVYTVMKTREAIHAVMETYRDFDRERRYAKAVMGVTDAQQEPLIKQAIHGGATSKYNDIQWLEGQRELAARGLNVDQVRAMTEVASTIGQAMDKSLPESVKALEAAMFGFGKDTSTYAAAVQNAGRTADLMVKGSKISGMTYDDLVELYKFGATPFRMANLSEPELLAFGGIGKKSNMGGAEMGTAARALAANLLSPTAGAKTAMLANGIDYSKYQTMNARPMDAGAFADDIAMKYGVTLEKSAKDALQKVFSNKEVVSNAAKFMPAIMKILGDELGGDDAKNKKSIAGEARRYRDASVSGVDSERLFRDVMVAIAKSPNLANVIFGAKQGARIRAAIANVPLFLEKLDELTNHSGGYAKEVSDQRMAGFDGAVSRFDGSVKNLETAIGRALDNGGKGGLLTGATDAAAKFVQALAEANPEIQKAGIYAAGVGASFAAIKTSSFIANLGTGFGLTTSAAALDEAAGALTLAAGRLGGADAAAGLLTKAGLPTAGAAGATGAASVGLLPLMVAGAVAGYADYWFNTQVGPTTRSRGRGAIAVEPVIGGMKLSEIPEGRQHGGTGFSTDRAGYYTYGRGGRRWIDQGPAPIEPVTPGFNMRPPGWDLHAGNIRPPQAGPAAPARIEFAPIAPIRIEIVAGSALLSVVDKLRNVQLKPENAPGGNGVTTTEQH